MIVKKISEIIVPNYKHPGVYKMTVELKAGSLKEFFASAREK